jgi:hypothetical protein
MEVQKIRAEILNEPAQKRGQTRQPTEVKPIQSTYGFS